MNKPYVRNESHKQITARKTDREKERKKWRDDKKIHKHTQFIQRVMHFKIYLT